MLLNALLVKIINHENSKYATNSNKAILAKKLIKAREPKNATTGIAYARLLLQYFTKKDRGLLAKLKIRVKEPKNG